MTESSDGTDDSSGLGQEADGSDQNQAVRDIAKGAGVVYTGLVIEIVFAFLAQVLAARFLSVSDFGSVTAGVELLNLGAIIAALGLGNGLARYLPRQDDEQRVATTRAAILIVVPAGIVLGGLVTFNAEFLATAVFDDPRIEPSIRIFGATIPFAAALRMSIGGIRGQKVSRYRVYVENLVRPLLRFGLVVTATIYGLSQAGFAGAYAIPYWVGAIFALWLLLRSLPRSIFAGRLDRGNFRSVLRYSLPFTVTGAGNFVYRSADVFLVLYFLNSEALGAYAVAYAAARLVLMFSTAFNFLSLPVGSEISKNDDVGEAAGINRKILRWLAILTIPMLVPLVIFSSDTIAVIYGARYTTAGTTLAILAIGFAVHNTLTIQNTLLKVLGYSKLAALNTSITAATNIALNLFLIPRMGIAGAAIATAVSYVLLDLVAWGELKHFNDIKLLHSDVGKIVAISLPLFWATWHLEPRIPGTLFWIGLTSAVFGGAFVCSIVLLLGTQPEEVMLVRSVEEKYGVNLWPITPIVEKYCADLENR